MIAWKAFQRTARKVGPYEVLEKLGQGGMASVYRGRNRITGDIVALKIVPAKAAGNPVLRKRFEQEFRAARRLDHPNIVRALDFGQDKGTLYLALELVQGPTLGQRIDDDGALPEDDAVRLIVQIARALHQAHQQGIIHRDVKPDNILITRDNDAKLSDLGLIKDIEGEFDLTQPLSGLGTPNFAAPEQFNDASHADARCDVYSLAATLYMAVTGELPFRSRNTLGIFQKKIKNDLAPPRQLVPTLSQELEWVILRAVSADPGHRPASCQEFIEDLMGTNERQLLGCLAGSVCQQKAPPRPRKRVGREQRATVRHPCALESSCRPVGEEKENSWSGRVQDISTRGMCLLLSRRFEPGTVLIVDVDGKEERQVRTLLVRVVRVKAHSPRKWIVGCVVCGHLNNEDVQTLV